MQLVIIQELVEAVGARIVLLILLVHDGDVIDEFAQKRHHALRCSCELHDLIERPIDFSLRDGAMDLEVALEPRQGRRRVEAAVLKPVELLVDVLLREDEDLELFRFDQVGTLGHLFDEHAQKVAPLAEEIIGLRAKGLLLGQRRYVQARQSLDEAIPEGQEVLVSSFDLIGLH